MKQQFEFGYFFSEGVRSIFTHGFMSFAAVCMIICCLLIMGSFSLVALNLDHMLGDLERENEILAYVEETYTQEQTAALQSVLEQLPNVDRVEFESKEEAQKAYEADKTENELFQNLPASVYRDRFHVHVTDIEQMEATSQQVENTEGVAKIRAELEVAEGFVVIRNVAGAVAIILVLVLLVMSLFIISNTIRLATFHRREEIAIMKMCGATNSFVRWPFVFEGMLLGLIGAAAAFVLQWGIYALVGNAIVSSDTISLITVLPFRQMAVKVLAIFAGTGLVIGAGGSVLAIRRFLQV